jgi:hypothetical protein
VDGISKGADLMERRWLKQVTDALEMHGIAVVGYKDGKKHVKITVTDGKSTRFIVTSVSPSDRRSLMNIVQTAKKTLSKDGAVRR